MTGTLQDIMSTIAVDGVPKCDVYTASAALDRAREEHAANSDARVTIYQWNNRMYAYNPYTDTVDPVY